MGSFGIPEHSRRAGWELESGSCDTFLSEVTILETAEYHLKGAALNYCRISMQGRWCQTAGQSQKFSKSDRFYSEGSGQNDYLLHI